MLTTLADECAFLKAVITSYINLIKNRRTIKTFCHPTPDSHTLKKIKDGKLARVGHSRRKGDYFFIYSVPDKQMENYGLHYPQRKKNYRKKKEKKDKKIARLRLRAPSLQP